MPRTRNAPFGVGVLTAVATAAAAIAAIVPTIIEPAAATVPSVVEPVPAVVEAPAPAVRGPVERWPAGGRSGGGGCCGRGSKLVVCWPAALREADLAVLADLHLDT